MRDDDPLDESAEQTQWRDIAAAVRAQLAKQVEHMPAMKPDEVLAIANAIDMAMWVELKAATHDASVEERLVTLERTKSFGN